MEARVGVRRIVLVGLLAAACALFAYRGPLRALRAGGNYDFTLIYSSARAWLLEGRPYEVDAVSRAWLSSGGPAERDPTLVRGAGTLVYPPPTFPLLAPFVALPWSVAAPLWTMSGVLMYLASVRIIAGLAGLRGDGALGYWTLALAMGPAMTSIGTGQTAVPALFCIAAGYAGLRRRAPGILRGVLMGAGACLKPQLGGLFPWYEAGRGRWRTFVGAALLGTIAAVAIGRMMGAGTAWTSQLTTNLSTFVTLDDANPTQSNPISYQLIDLAYPLHTLTDNRAAVKVAVYSVVGGLCLAFFIVDWRRGRRKGDQPGELVSLSMVSVVTLLVAYHRYYDAVFLIFPLALALRGLLAKEAGPPRWMYVAAMLLVLSFLAPGAALLVMAKDRGMIPAGLADSALWRGVLVPHAQWALLALGVLLVFIRARTGEVTQRST
jgi:hypothetical protein